MSVIRLRVADKAALEKVKGLLDSILQPAPTIKQLCRSSGLNADKLKKGFKLLYGEPPHRYLLLRKMEKAKTLLSETELSVSEIAFALGYEDASNFCAGFKREVGVTAGGWRRIYSKGY
jgi:AraC-like DNA-binding protein